MPNWIDGGGFYLVQANEPYDVDKIKREMDELEAEIQTAERYWAERKAMTA